MPQIFDAHMHIQPWHMMLEKVKKRMWHGRDSQATVLEYAKDPGKFIAFLDAENIHRAVLVNYVSPDVMGFTAETNDWIAHYTKGRTERLLPMGSVHPRFCKDPAAEVKRLVDMGIRGLKIHPPHQLMQANEYLFGLRALEQVYAAASEHGLPIMIHTGTSIFPGARNRFADPMAVDDVACDFPDLRLILAHAGRPIYMQTCIFLVRRHPNVWMDISGIPPKSLLEYLPNIEKIADKVLWGTDWPAPGVPSPKRNVEQFCELSISKKSQEKILSHNAELVFGDAS